MDTPVDHLDPLPENLLGYSVSRRAWNGVSLEVTEFQCAGRVVHQIGNDADARLSAVVDEVGEHCEPRLREDEPCPIPYMPRHMFYAPAGMEVWGYSANTRYVKDAMLTFDPVALGDRLATQFDASVIHTPRLRFVDDRLWTLVKLLADAVSDPDPSAQLYGDGLTAAIAARLWSRPPGKSAAVEKLAPWQLRRVLEHMDASLPDHVTLAELAELTGLSQWHFSRAFKGSTGVPPYRWQLEARIRRAQALLLDTGASLEQVAAATGFADTVHFGKTFRKLIGMTPGAWRRLRRNQ
jgi:AraC family transcriptional regulator